MTETERNLLSLSQLLGFPHYDYLLPFLSSKQLLDWQKWQAYYGMTPSRNDVFWANNLWMFYSAHKDDNSPNLSFRDFIFYGDKPEDQLPDGDINQEEFISKIRGLLGK